MPFCIGQKACARAKCKANCTAAFPNQPDLERGCKNACKVDSSLTKEKYLCSGNWVAQEVIMGAYGYDPCLGDSLTQQDYLDPLNDRERSEERFRDLQPVFLGLGILILAALAVLYVVKK